MVLTRERVCLGLHDDTDVSSNEFICIAGAIHGVAFVRQCLEYLGADATKVFLNHFGRRVELQQVSSCDWTAEENISEDNWKLVRHPNSAACQGVIENGINQPSLLIDGMTTLLKHVDVCKILVGVRSVSGRLVTVVHQLRDVLIESLLLTGGKISRDAGRHRAFPEGLAKNPSALLINAHSEELGIG